MCNWRGSRPRELGGDKFGRPFVGLKTVSQMESNGQWISLLNSQGTVRMVCCYLEVDITGRIRCTVVNNDMGTESGKLDFTSCISFIHQS
jgi:hypothetical protein